MTTTFIKNALIRKVKKMNSRDLKTFYGLMIERNVNESLYKTFGEIPIEERLAIKKGLDDLKKGKKQEASLFIKNIKLKYA